jgi:hypothetical protein
MRPGGWQLFVSLAIVCSFLLLAVSSLSLPTRQADQEQFLDCSDCHTCEHPSKAHPCLKAICPRHEAMEDLEAGLGPATVILDELENLYAPVNFDHKAHAEMVKLSGGCEICHHFTPPNQEHPACIDCHPTSIIHEDLAQPGLKGAYHRNCMSCHQEWDVDTACEICHEKKVPGQATVVHTESHYQPIALEELLLFATGYAEGDTVPFHHRNHSVMYERDCSECHQEQSCTRCHVQGRELHPMGEPTETDFHDTCYGCHHEEPCSDCHGRDADDLFEHADTGWPLKVYHSNLHCRGCHGEKGQFKKLTPVCENCHPKGWRPDTFDHQQTGVALGDVHGELECEHCHVDGAGEAPSCDGCHDDGRGYNRATGFGDS